MNNYERYSLQSRRSSNLTTLSRHGVNAGSIPAPGAKNKLKAKEYGTNKVNGGTCHTDT